MNNYTTYRNWTYTSKTTAPYLMVPYDKIIFEVRKGSQEAVL